MKADEIPSLSEVPSCDLVDRWREGDNASGDELHRRYYDQLLRLVGHHLSAKYAKQFGPEEQRKAIELRLQGYSKNEIAEQLGVTDRTVRRMWERIRQSVTSLFRESPDLGP